MTRRKQAPMADPLTPTQRAFIPIQKQADLPGAVQLARAVVIRELLTGGFEDDAASLASKLAGEYVLTPNQEIRWDMVCAQLLGALAMGIALGQLVHPDVFKGGRVK
jgi:hypothetical protein